MYTGTNQTGNRKKRHRRKKLNFLPVLLFIVVISVCAIAVVLAINGVKYLFRQGAHMLAAPPKSSAQYQSPGTTGPDTTPPQLAGVQDILVYQGDTVAYRKNITVTDNADPAPRLDVDSSGVNLSVPGSYEVVYTATDAAGNVATAKATLTVLAKQAGFIDMETINEAADRILADIIQPGDTTRQKVKAIYAWARTNVGYAGHSDRTDWRQTAYTVMRQRQGDCFGYFAVCKLLFERLGIPNIDVVKVKNTQNDSSHFWSLVSIDGGENYYHFDATPRVGDGDYFCLVTDAFIDAYSETHKNSHHRDPSLYPATPKEALP